MKFNHYLMEKQKYFKRTTSFNDINNNAKAELGYSSGSCYGRETKLTFPKGFFSVSKFLLILLT